MQHKLPILKMACDDFFSKAAGPEKRNYERFCKDEAYWLDDFALYASIAEHTGEIRLAHMGTRHLSMREPKALAAVEQKAGR